MLSVKSMRVVLEGQEILSDLSLDVPIGKVVAVIGRNGCGKSTALRAIMGLVPMAGGSVQFFNEDLGGLATPKRSERGIAYVPQSGAVFRNVSVGDNLKLGGRLLPDQSQLPQRIEAMYELFPVLRERCKAAARLLSGGQLRMLAVAMALVRDAKVLLLDEPSAGLAPSVAERLLEQLITAAGRDRGVLLVEQNVQAALQRSDEVHVIRHGAASPPLKPADVLARQSILEIL
jgi:branched-chain amino acid transport system ATP-binding protein